MAKNCCQPQQNNQKEHASHQESCCTGAQENTEVRANDSNDEKMSCSSDDRNGDGDSDSESDQCCSSASVKTEQKEIEQTTREYNVSGMDCSGCASTIEKHLQMIPAVQHVHVSVATGKMRVSHVNSVKDIVKEVSKIGFQATLIKDGEFAEQPKQEKAGFSLLIFSGILIATGFIGTYMDVPALISTLLFATAIGLSGFRPVKSAYYALRIRSLDMNVLMSIAAIGAAIIGEWFEGATVVWLFSLGNALQARSMEQTRKSIRNLMDLAPSVAWVRRGGEIVKERVDAIHVGDVMVIKPGDRISLDGEIIVGDSSINQAPITGESIPVDKSPGDTVFAGTINESGALEVKVTTLAQDTTIAKIIHLVEEAQDRKAPSEAFIDKFASVYTPIVVAIAASVMIIPPLFQFGTWGEWAYKGLALLIIACPCALVISTPVAIVSAIGNAAKHGVLIKGGTFLEKAGAINAVAFDKTGTLTEGKPIVQDVYPIGTSEKELLEIIRTLEERSTHPIAKAIVAYANDLEIQSRSGESFINIPGKGVQAKVDGTVYYAGNLKLYGERLITSEVEKIVKKMENAGKTIVIVGTNESIVGVISVADSIRPVAVDAVKRLKRTAVNQVVMLTGDNDGTAKEIAKEANVSRYIANLLPEDKVAAISQLQEEGYHVAMVGDGINDAPALATADLGVAMGGVGTDTAMDTADIVLMADNLEKLPYTMKLSQKALMIIKQNIYFSVFIKVIALLLIFPGWLTLWLAVLSDTGAAIIVILNSLRLVNVKDN